MCYLLPRFAPTGGLFNWNGCSVAADRFNCGAAVPTAGVVALPKPNPDWVVVRFDVPANKVDPPAPKPAKTEEQI